jgi:hypothetical protein
MIQQRLAGSVNPLVIVDERLCHVGRVQIEICQADEGCLVADVVEIAVAYDVNINSLGDFRKK